MTVYQMIQELSKFDPDADINLNIIGEHDDENIDIEVQIDGFIEKSRYDITLCGVI